MNKQEFLNKLYEILDNLPSHQIVRISNEVNIATRYNRFISSMSEFDYDIHMRPTQLARAICGGRFNPNHTWYYFDDLGHLYSFDYPDWDVDVDGELIAEYIEDSGECFGISAIEELMEEYNQL